jgi:hypothetical protein
MRIDVGPEVLEGSASEPRQANETNKGETANEKTDDDGPWPYAFQAHNVNNCQAQPCGARWALWPGSIVVNPADNSALIFYMLVSARPGSFNFQAIGTSVATWQNIKQKP